jgi:hypothetical protein
LLFSASFERVGDQPIGRIDVQVGLADGIGLIVSAHTLGSHTFVAARAATAQL